MTSRLRTTTRADIAAAMALKDAAGWNQTEADWERLLSAGPDGCFAAEVAGEVVGVVTTIVYDARLTWVGMMLVDSRHRHQGLGSALLERAIRHSEDRRVTAIRLDATPQGRPLYERFGFAAEYELERWVLKRPGGTAPGTTAVEDIADVLVLDREVFGADRSAILQSLAAEAPHLVQVCRRGGAVVGYTFGRHGTLADQLGPWVARDRDVADSLLQEFLRRTANRVFVDCVRDHSWVRSLLEGRGFTLSRTLTRMVRGAPPAPAPQALCAILGPEFG